MAVKQKLYVGDTVKIPGPMGWMQVTVTAVDYAKGTFTDDIGPGYERKISSILK